MSWFRKKRVYAVYYQVDGYLSSKRYFIIKASDIAEAARLCQKREVFPISIIDWEVLETDG